MDKGCLVMFFGRVILSYLWVFVGFLLFQTFGDDFLNFGGSNLASFASLALLLNG